MYIIVGLGNPSREYKGTRHNIGFDVIDVLADKYNIDVGSEKHKSLVGKGVIDGEKVILVKPQTFMNLSGEAVLDVVQYYKIDVRSELIVIYDDIALDLGMIRVRAGGSAGGHNGMKNIISLIGSENFMRIRMGVGDKPKEYDLKDYVLSRFSDEEREVMNGAVVSAVNAVESIINDGVELTMTKFNRKNSSEAPTDTE